MDEKMLHLDLTLRLLQKVAVRRIINSQNMHPSKEMFKLLIIAAFSESCSFKLMIFIHIHN